ncbi:hypothetical protein [Kitasatospora purpeofusca]|uniref:hypothetical protein n=1 Tax=Kitasatospora purpeofusca TaxID=67352 RepID=UPI00324417CC|nr:hypothetical protein OIP63_33555 [Kitasatospora purpeofusca]
MYPVIPTIPPLPKRIRGDRFREARARHETGDWQAWPDVNGPEQPTADDQRQDES